MTRARSWLNERGFEGSCGEPIDMSRNAGWMTLKPLRSSPTQILPLAIPHDMPGGLRRMPRYLEERTRRRVKLHEPVVIGRRPDGIARAPGEAPSNRVPPTAFSYP